MYTVYSIQLEKKIVNLNEYKGAEKRRKNEKSCGMERKKEKKR